MTHVLAARTILPDGAGDLWSLLFVVVVFALLFALIEGLKRV